MPGHVVREALAQSGDRQEEIVPRGSQTRARSLAENIRLDRADAAHGKADQQSARTCPAPQRSRLGWPLSRLSRDHVFRTKVDGERSPARRPDARIDNPSMDRELPDIPSTIDLKI